MHLEFNNKIDLKMIEKFNKISGQSICKRVIDSFIFRLISSNRFSKLEKEHHLSRPVNEYIYWSILDLFMYSNILYIYMNFEKQNKFCQFWSQTYW